MADVPRPGVDHHPGASDFVLTNLDEVIAGTKRAQLAQSAVVDLRLDHGRARQLLAGSPRLSLLVMGKPSRDVAVNLSEYRLGIAAHLLAGDGQRESTHAATNVVADPGRDDNALGGHHCADG